MSTTEIIFWGATGQAKVLYDLLQQRTDAPRLVALFDNNPALSSPIPGVPLLYGEAGLKQWLTQRTAAQPPASLPSFAVAVGGGHGAARLQLMQLLKTQGLQPRTLIHPHASIAHDAILEDGCQILAGAVVCTRATIGTCAIINTRASVDHDCQIGAGAHVAPGATLTGEITVGPRAFIGAGAVVLPRLTIGADAVIGAGAVVTQNVAPNTTVVGVPARPLPVHKTTPQSSPK